MKNQKENAAFGLWLKEARGIGTGTVLKLFEAYRKQQGERERESFYDLAERLEGSGFAGALYQMEEKALGGLAREAFGEKGGERIRDLLLQARRLDPERAAAALKKQDISFVSLEDAAYPPRLRKIPDMPLGLYYKGKLPDPAMPAAAVIGARMSDAYGREQARRFAFSLAGAGICVVSGLARGIDGTAGRAALAAGGFSAAVLGSGVDVCYPPENRDLYEMLAEKGLILSEYKPGTPARAGLFPPRNRIISGLSDLILVVEAKAGSGTLITTDYALDQGREVFALPGRITDSLSEGCNRLLAQGASIVLSPRDLIEYFFGVRGGPAKTAPALFGKEIPSGLSELEKDVWLTLAGGRSMDLEEIAESLNTMTGRRQQTGNLMETVMMLILRDLAEEKSAGKYSLRWDS